MVDHGILIFLLVLSPHFRWGDLRIDITSRITPRNKVIRKFLALLTGNMHFKYVYSRSISRCLTLTSADAFCYPMSR